ncbi:MAG: DUF4347 domain-containing protein [Methylobacterium frigidaeris]
MVGQFVFIDARVSDVGTLIGGLVPGARVHLLDPARDGLAQIAAALRTAGAVGLPAISLVAHGEPGRLVIGPEDLTEPGLPARAEALARIAEALSPRGVLRLFACDVSSGDDGRRFVAALSAALGGRPVAAASQPLGQGAPWLLDHATAAGVDRSAPFAADSLSAYAGRLATFTPGSTATFPAPQFSGRAVTGDFDGDGDADIYYQTGGNGTAFQYAVGNSSGTYTIVPQGSSPFATVVLPQASTATAYRVADFNGDGRADVFVQTNGQDGAVYLSGAGGRFSEIATTGLSTLGFLARAAFGDFDGDGKADVLYQVGGDGSEFRFGTSNGNGTFTDLSQAASPFASLAVAQVSGSNYRVADFNGDGISDIMVVQNGTDGTVYLSNAGTGRFSEVANTGLTPLLANGRAAVADFDADGKADILYQVGGADSEFRFGKGNGNGTFTDMPQAASPFANVGIPYIGTGAYLPVDVDGDGDIDLRVTANSSTGAYLMQADAPPRIVGSTPATNGYGLARSANITLTFSETVARGTGTIKIVRIFDSAVVQSFDVTSSAVTISGATVTIDPPNDLDSGTTYALLIARGAFTDLGGAIFGGLTDLTTLRFTTQLNTTPTLNRNTGLTLNEGGSATLTAAALDFNDAEQADAAITYTVTRAPTNGSLTRGGTTLGLNATFTQDDVNNGRVAYTHDGTDTTGATFGFSVSDGQGGSIAAQTFSFTINPVNDAPTLAATTLDPTFTEGTGAGVQGGAVALFSGGGAGTGEGGQIITRITLTVSGLRDGAAETLSIGGGAVALVDGTTTANGITSAVAVANGTATVTVSGAGGFTPQVTAGLLNGLAYQNLNVDNPTAGSRTVTLTSVTDSGGTAGGGSDTALLSIASTVTVSPVDDAPVAAADSYSVVRSTPLVVGAASGLLANDSDIDGPSLSTILASGPRNGTLDLNGDGSFTYTPNAGYVGADSFTYRASDGFLDSPATIVSLIVGTPAPTGLALLAADDTGTAGDGRTSLGSVRVTGTAAASAAVTLFDDADADGVPDAGEATLGTTTAAANGTFSATLVLGADGTYRVVAVQDAGLGISPGAAALAITRDSLAPAVTGITVSGPGLVNGGGTLTVGQTATFAVDLSEAVSLSNAGGLTLGLSDGSVAALDAAGSTAGRLLFTRTVAANDIAADLAVTGLNRNGAAILDAAGNAIDPAGAAVNPAGILRIDGYTGGAGSDVFRGTTGADTFAGGGGDDFYVVDAGDEVIEAANDGYDRVLARTSYALEAGQAIEALYADATGSPAAIDLTGNEFRNVLQGSVGRNRLDGGAGADILIGLAGDDTYLVDDEDDQVIEAVGGGTDTVLASVSYLLRAGQEVEILAARDEAAATALDLTGNGFAQSLRGNAGRNRLSGGGGGDVLTGLQGDDVYVVDAGDRVIEAAGGGYDRVLARTSYALEAGQAIEALYADATGSTAAIDLTGNEAANVILGSYGANVLDGGAGADLLQGYAGNDTFVFASALVSGVVDRIRDFGTGAGDDDAIRLSSAVFGLASGGLSAGAFKDLSQGAADGDDRILYDRTTGGLFYDADGSGAGERQQFALLENRAVLTAGDFTVV